MADVCPICGKKVLRTGSNWAVNDGVLIHKKCPKVTSTLSKEESRDRKMLLDEIANLLAFKPRGYVADTGLNWMKVNRQIKQLKDKGYSYADQLYALGQVVILQDGFWGYTAVVNNIDPIMLKKREKDKVMQQALKPRQAVEFDLSKYVSEGDDEW